VNTSKGFLLFSRRAWCFHQAHNGVSVSNSDPIVVVLGENTKHGGKIRSFPFTFFPMPT
jgi:hypothetical protein